MSIHQTRRCFLQGLVALVTTGTALKAAPPENADDRKEVSILELTKAIKVLRPAFDDFEPTDWSRRHPDETKQTLDQYVRSNPNRPTAKRRTLYVQPIGDVPESYETALTATYEILRLVFGSPVKELPAVSLNRLPASARRVHPSWGVKQVLSTYLLDHVLKPLRPDDAIAVLGITASDLWPGDDWNFVFGQASLSERVGVWSLNRFGDPTESAEVQLLFVLRTLKVAVHETGHMFGIRHCVHFRCGMNGSNSLPETDDGPLAFCPECVAKICWATQVQPAVWFEQLAAFGKKHKLSDRGIWEDCVALLKRA